LPQSGSLQVWGERDSSYYDRDRTYKCEKTGEARKFPTKITGYKTISHAGRQNMLPHGKKMKVSSRGGRPKVRKKITSAKETTEMAT